jgi:hypothetical protein
MQRISATFAASASAAPLLQIQGQVRRAASVRCQAVEGPGRGERYAEEAAGGSDLGQRHAQGYRFKKMVTPAAKREAVAHLQVQFHVSERRALQSSAWIGPRCIIAADQQTTTRSALACAP